MAGKLAHGGPREKERGESRKKKGERRRKKGERSGGRAHCGGAMNAEKKKEHNRECTRMNANQGGDETGKRRGRKEF
jgi:hypothetical protein